MNRNLLPEQLSSQLRTRYLWLGIWTLLTLLSACQWTTKDSEYQPLPKKITQQPKPEKKEIVKDTIDFSQCEVLQDMMALLNEINHLSTIDAQEYFNNQKEFFTQANISQQEFLSDYYSVSDIVRFGVYSDDYQISYTDYDIRVLNKKILSSSGYTTYINNPENIVTHGLRKILKKLYPNMYKKNSGDKYTTYPDIPRWNYTDNARYPRWESREILDQNHIFVKSSALWYKETGDNYGGDRTCLHGIEKNTMWYIVALAQCLQQRYGLDLCIKYKIVTTTGWTEKGSHIDAKNADDSENYNDHPWWKKSDLSVNGKAGILLWKYFADYWIVKLQEDKLMPIGLQIEWYDIEVIPHAAHFDILVVRKL